MTEKKITLPIPMNQDCKKIKVKTKKIKNYQQIFRRIEINELIYAGVKLVCDEIGVPQRKRNRNTKHGWEI